VGKELKWFVHCRFVHCRLISSFKWLVTGNVNAETNTLVNPSVSVTTYSVASGYIQYVMSHAPDYIYVVMISSIDKCVIY
jgi:hypothetical protein